ncbi:MAG: lysophospholipid acyltransferase family protein [Verrucomicrobiia bacterium]
MDRAFYCVVACLLKGLQALPLPWVAWIGRQGGGVAFWLDARHRKVALRNLARCYGTEKSRAEIRALAQQHFRRLGENYASAVKTAAMSWAELAPHVEFAHAERILPTGKEGASRSCVVAIGHFGNFELYARLGQAFPGYQCATTYRALKQPAMNRLLQEMRARSGCLFFERRTESGALKTALATQPLLLGLLADQYAGRKGVPVVFFGQLCSASAAPAILALRYRCPLFTGFCYRVALGRWRIEPGEQIPTHADGRPRPVQEITADINRAFEAAVRRDPANWFWVHNRWKTSRSMKAGTPPEAPLGHRVETEAASSHT